MRVGLRTVPIFGSSGGGGEEEEAAAPPSLPLRAPTHHLPKPPRPGQTIISPGFPPPPEGHVGAGDVAGAAAPAVGKGAGAWRAGPCARAGPTVGDQGETRRERERDGGPSGRAQGPGTDGGWTPNPPTTPLPPSVRALGSPPPPPPSARHYRGGGNTGAPAARAPGGGRRGSAATGTAVFALLGTANGRAAGGRPAKGQLLNPTLREPVRDPDGCT